MTPTIRALVATECFVDGPGGARQVVWVELTEPWPTGVAGVISVDGSHQSSTVTVPQGATRVEVPVDAPGAVGERIPLRCVLLVDGEERASTTGELVVAEPGWTVHMVSHFHYDPVWWNTQGAYTSGWDFLTDDGLSRPLFEHNGFALVQAHIDMALRDPDYKFVLAELDYLKPFWDTVPHYRAALRQLLHEGRLELMGGTYNEPNTNLTGSETTIRNLVYGVGYQRDVLGGDPQTGWQLDVFGHDPQFPGLLAAAGLSSSSWARGPFHQWGPAPSLFGTLDGDTAVMEFETDFEWISPSGLGVLTHYMPNHYSAGWWMDAAPNLAAAEEAVYQLFLSAKKVAATKHTLLPVGTDYTPPNLWVTEIHRDWNRRYLSPRFVCSTPREYFAAVRQELDAQGRSPTPQSRDMNPIYTGKDVSYIDTKQALRAIEVLATDAEKFATLAGLLADGGYPERAMDKVWRQLAFGAHHDGITGSESDQVYLDLLAGWREAHDLASSVLDASLDRLVAGISGPGGRTEVVVFNGLSFTRSAPVEVTVELDEPASAVRVLDGDGTELPHLSLPPSEAGRAHRVQFLASDVPGIGWRTCAVVPAEAAVDGAHGWVEQPDAQGVIANEHYRVAVDPERGGGLGSVVHLASGRELLRGDQIGNELRIYEEYPAHPTNGEGPWHLLPSGPSVSSGAQPAGSVRVEHSALGQRIVVTSEVDGVHFEQTTTLWSGSEEVELTTRLVDFAGADRLVRLRVPAEVRGGLPVSNVASAVVGRGFAHPDSDTAEHPWTLDNPSQTWFALGSTAHVAVDHADGSPPTRRAIGIVEIIAPPGDTHAQPVRDLVVGLARRGVTATVTRPSAPRYGWLDVDSNLPDARIVLGGPDANPVAAELLTGRDASYQALLDRTVATDGHGAVWVAAGEPLRSTWRPGADLRDLGCLPAVILAGADDDQLIAAVDEVVWSLEAATRLWARAPAPTATDREEDLEDFTVALLTQGTPGFAVDPDGGLNVSLMRSCTGWPSGIWIDPPKRTVPDGSAFQLQHWTHEFRCALVAGPGDWRAVDLQRRGDAWSSPLHARTRSAGHDTERPRPALPPVAAALTAQPADRVVIQAVKPTGNPSAQGRLGTVDPAEGVTIRLVELQGAPVTGTVTGLLDWTAGRRADLLEQPAGDPLPAQEGRLEVALVGSEIATVVAVPPVPAVAAERQDRSPLGPEQEPIQPSYARYWLHNRGPAPMGFLPVAVAAEPTSFIAHDRQHDLRSSVASHLVDQTAVGVLRVTVPDGWTAEPGEQTFALLPGGYQDFQARVRIPEDAPPGLYLLSVLADLDTEQVEDVVSVAVPDPAGGVPALAPQRHQTDPVPDPVKTRGTDRTEGRDLGCDVKLQTVEGPEGTVLRVDIANRTRSPIGGELQLISPWGTWAMIGPARRGVEVAPGGQTRVETDVVVPPGTRGGEWWVLAKWMWAGRVQYTPAVPLIVAGN